MNEGVIQNRLKTKFHTHDYKLCNAYIFKHDWESDFFSLSKSGYYYEVEIKISRSDFKADFKKEKHSIFQMEPGKLYLKRGYETCESRFVNGEWIKIPSTNISFKKKEDYNIPHKFYYAVPDGLITKDECPKYAGLIYVSECDIRTVKEAPFLHKTKMNLTQTLLDKFYHRNMNLDYEIEMLRMENKRLREINEPTLL